MAPGDEYSAVGGGGKLKLKGVKDGRVEKKKKKKKEKEGEVAAQAEREASAGAAAAHDHELREEEDEAGYRPVGKTEAERKYEEARRKRVCYYSFLFLPTPPLLLLAFSLGDGASISWFMLHVFVLPLSSRRFSHFNPARIIQHIIKHT